MDQFGALAIAAVGLAQTSGIAHFIMYATANGSLARNSAIGLRTRATTSSDAAWDASHAAAAPWLRACAYSGYAAGALTVAGTVAAAVAGVPRPGALLIVPGVGFAAVLALIVTAGVVADRAGRDADPG
ncbi:SdpI family protein [Streptomonospora salina]|uniref:SdpI family protein n=1 Tax=Streptomonospora salina TaxID=104205 RepID=A0A841E2L5_9ACTN|nr:SdpI family protein [Streptomonospora salina]MBB5997385.1 hypothetical protein [Streptomonospora salina]